MRGFIKAAALLFSHSVASFVVPNHAALNQPIANEGVDYRKLLGGDRSQFVLNAYTIVGSDEATLNFSFPIDTLEPNEASQVPHPPFACRDPCSLKLDPNVPCRRH